MSNIYDAPYLDEAEHAALDHTGVPGVGQSGASDLSAYEGESIHLTSTDGSVTLTSSGNINLNPTDDVQVNGAPIGATDLSAYVGPSVSLEATAGGIELLTETDDAGISLNSGGANGTIELSANGTGGTVQVTADAGITLLADVAVLGNVGFYATAPVAQQTGVTVDAAGIHAALVALGLFTGP